MNPIEEVKLEGGREEEEGGREELIKLLILIRVDYIGRAMHLTQLLSVHSTHSHGNTSEGVEVKVGEDQRGGGGGDVGGGRVDTRFEGVSVGAIYSHSLRIAM